VVFFDCNAMHGSNGNITPYPRSNVFFVYNSVENALVEPFGGLEPRPEYIASRDFRPIGTD
ncbi:MAG: ectoine hydroxylase, partial [Candidatus Krumholzibacteriia bacterium]